MTRGILIAGIESSLSSAIGAEAGRRVEKYATALIPPRLTEPARERSEEGAVNAACIPLNWNPGSPIAARTLVLAAQNRLERVDEVILVCTPPSMRRQADELVPADIDAVVNDHIKGWFFLVKEITAIFKAQKAGMLALVLQDVADGSGRGEAVDLMGPSVAGAFRALAQGLLVAGTGKPYQTMAFSTESGDENAFASFVFKSIDEGGGKRGAAKWRYFGKFPFFNR
jgi:hypothetical protein